MGGAEWTKTTGSPKKPAIFLLFLVEWRQVPKLEFGEIFRINTEYPYVHQKFKQNDNSGTILLRSTCHKIPELVEQRMIDAPRFFPPISRFKSAFRCGNSILFLSARPDCISVQFRKSNFCVLSWKKTQLSSSTLSSFSFTTNHVSEYFTNQSILCIAN